MQLQLYQHNRRTKKLEHPSLQEILEMGNPFAITLPLKEGQRVPDEIVMANWNCPNFSTWPGIRILDYDNGYTHLIHIGDYKAGNTKFTSKPEIDYEWSYDKYLVRANWYRFQGQYPKEIFDEFRKLGFLFDNNAP